MNKDDIFRKIVEILHDTFDIEVERITPQARLYEDLDIDSIDDRAKAAEIIISLASALSVHDPKTRGHAERVRAYTDLLAEELGIPAEDANKLRWAAPLHDIGKLRVPSEILNTDVPLTEEQWRIVRSHPIEGMKVSAQLVEWLGPWANAIAHHHDPAAAGDERMFCALIGLADQAAYASLGSHAPAEHDAERTALLDEVDLGQAQWEDCLLHLHQARATIGAFVGAIQ